MPSVFAEAQQSEPSSQDQRPTEWTPPAPIRSSESRPPKIPESVEKPHAVFTEEMAGDSATLRAARVLRIPVVKTAEPGSAGRRDEGELTALGRALAGYQRAGGGESAEGRQTLERFVELHGDGDYAASVRLELADAYWRTGAWEKALDQWEQAWARASKHAADDVEARRLGDVVLAKLITHTGLLGRKDRLRAILDGIEGRKNGGDARAAIHRGKELLWFLDNRAEQNVFCGFSAANLVCIPLGQKAIFPDVHDKVEEAAFIASGVSLWDIAEHSAEGGGNLRCVQKTVATAPLAVPSVIHWKFGHFSALTERSEDGKIRLEDAQLKFNSWVEPEVLAEGGSGYALVPRDGDLPAGYREVPEAEARTIFGRHCVHGYDDEGCDCETGCGGDSRGMATYALNLRRAYHTLSDIPLAYPTPGDDQVQFGLEYSARPPVETALSHTFGFGPLWFSAFAGGCVELKGTGSPNSKVEWHTGSGSYNTYTRSGSVYVRRQSELPIMSHIATGGYRLTFSDGSLQDYTVAAGSPVTRYLLTRAVDPQGQERTLGYDSQARLMTITDEWNLTSVLSYVPEPGDQASATTFPGLIRRITDPHGRFATFFYDAEGRLVKITDQVGISSTFAYDDGDVITALTTPYGKTTFELTEGGWASVIATDPRGFKEKVVQTDNEPLQILNATGGVVSGGANDFRVRNWDNNMDTGYHGDPAALAPTSVNGTTFLPKNGNLHWRNSFHWDKKAMHHSPDDWNAATVYNWKANTDSYIVPALSSMRSPGQGRIWFNYPDQTSADGPISSYQPSKTVRRIEDESGAPAWTMTRQTYNSLGLPLVSTDELGRQTRINYAANGQDILTVEAWIDGAWTVLRTYGYPSPNLHLPSTITEASGLVTGFIYNAMGQVTEVQRSKGSDVETTRLTYAATGNGSIPAWPGDPGFLRKVERSTGSGSWGITDQFSYDSIGRVRTHTDADGYQQMIDYDDFDRVTLVTHPDGSTQQFSFNRLDLQGTKDRGGRWTRTLHNAARDPVTEIAADGRMTFLEWCLCGQLQKLTDPLGRETKWTWAPGGYLMEKLMPDGATKTTYTYEPNSGRLATVTRPNDQGTASPTSTYRYFVDGSLQKEDYNDATTPDVIYAYEPGNLGRLTSITDGIGTHAFSYLPFTSGTAGAGRLQYLNGPLTNDRVENVYDWQDRVGTENLIGDSTTTNLRTQTSTWDFMGRLKTVSNALGVHTYNFSNYLPRPDSLSGPNGVTSVFSYHPNTAPGDSARRLESITHTRGAIQQAKHVYSYDSAGRITAWEQQSIGEPDMKTVYAYNLVDELVRAEDTNLTTSTLANREIWGLDQGGNWLSRSRSAGAVMETRTVNLMNRLTDIGGAGSTVVEGHVNEFAAVAVNGQPAALSADPATGGYRFKKAVPVTEGSNTVNITATDPQSETTSEDWQFTVPAVSRSFAYDDNGNTLSDGIRTFTWDAKNRLRTVTKDGVIWKWDYDYRDRRVREYQDNALVKVFVWQENDIVQERSASNVVTRTHYFGGFSDGPTAANGTKYQTLADHLGNVREVLTDAGILAARYDYTPYQGPVKVGASTVDTTFQTIGRYYHHTGSGLELALFRAYDPELGRWMSEDPIGESDGPNVYGFVRSRPIHFVDLEGKAGWGFAGAGWEIHNKSGEWEYSKCAADPRGEECRRKCAREALGFAVAGGGMVISGQPLVPKDRYMGGSPRTSVASKCMERLFKKRKLSRTFFPRGLPAPTNFNPKARTRSIARLCGRWTPFVGWGLLAYDVYGFGKCMDDCMGQ